MNAIVGDWGNVFDTTIIGIHQVMLEDGRVLYWGGDGKGNAFSNTQKYGIFDPATGEHEILSASHAVRMFCGAGVVLPGTDKVLIAGGNGTGAAGGQIFDTSDETLVRDSANDMANGRFYPTMVSLSSGQAVIFGGNGNADLRGTPEIFTLGEGWRTLDGAKDADLGTNWWYPRVWQNDQGELVYFAISAGNQNATPGAAGSFEVMAMDPSGDGSIRQIGELPFRMDVTSPSAMFEPGKIVIMDHVGDLWVMDINGDTPEYEKVATLGGDRNNSDMTVMADGRILINGGTKVGNSQDINNAILESVIFDPFSGEVTVVVAEDVMRLYHSSSLLLADGTILSMGGGGLGGTLDFMDAQIYRPDYLFNDDGTLADRPVITLAPESVEPGDEITIQVDDTSTIARLSLVKTGSVTHSLNMESGRMDLEFEVVSGTELKVSLPENPHVLGAGNWMLFAIDDQGVPSEAPIISVEPTLPLYTEPGVSENPIEGQISVEYFEADAKKLSEVDFDGTPLFQEDLTKIQESAGTGAFYNGGRTDKFAAQYTSTFRVDVAGQYTFFLKSDDGSNLSINDQQIILNDGLHGDVEKSATVYLDAGIHSLVAQYFEYTGRATMELDWREPGMARKDFEVNGTAPEEPTDPTDPTDPGDPTIVGTSGADVLDGTSGDDVVDMKGGRDVFISSAGDDYVDGGDAGYNQIDYAGKSDDYQFIGNDDGTTTVIKPNGTDTIVNIGGFWFAGERKWKPLEDVITYDPDAGPNTIEGSDDDDFLFGTKRDDIVNLGAGRDVINGSAGNDRIDGGDSGYNQIDYDGDPDDYTFTANDDGTVTVQKPNGTDIISNIGGFWFKGPGVWLPLEDVLESDDGGDNGGGDNGGGDNGGGDNGGGDNGGGDNQPDPILGTKRGEWIDGTDGDDVILAGGGVDTIFGSKGNDIIDGEGGGYNQVNYQADSKDFTFTLQDDGSVLAVSDEFGEDVLINIGGVWFNEEGEWYAIDDLL